MTESYNSNNTVAADVLERVTADPFAQHLGIEVVEVSLGRAVIRMKVQPWMANAMGTPHGGAIFALVDTALAFASNSYGTKAVALDVNITYCRPALIGSTVTATAEQANLTRRTGLYLISAKSEDGKLIASARGTVFRTEDTVR
jgi:acyl-CoA thioesterase